MINGKWKISLLKIIGNECPKRFGVLKKELDNLAQGTLSGILKELESDGMILRIAYAEISPRVEYKLTEKGIAFFTHHQINGRLVDEFFRGKIDQYLS